MYFHSLPFPKHSLHTPPSNQHQKLPFPPISKPGLFNSSKRVSVSRLGSRRSGRMSLIRCGDQHIAQEQKHEKKKHDDDYDGIYMRRCVELAKKAIGCTSPNPMVGCVIVKDGEIIGQGFHPKAGQPHAEVFALRDAGDLAENSTTYVTLEPCNHYGRTPPCSEALIKAKVRKVVVGMVDPNPLVASRGVKKLQEAGIEVKVGVEEEMCKKLNEAFNHLMLTGKPFVTLRYSISLDGHLLYQLGEEAKDRGGYYSKLLQEYDAIMLSTASITEASIPKSNEPGPKQPLKILLSKNSIAMINSEAEEGQKGNEMVSFDRARLVEILDNCKSRGLCSVLIDVMSNRVECEEILKEGFEHNLIQKVVVEVLPVLGGDEGSMLSFMDVKAEVKNLTSKVSGKSVLLEGYL